MARKPRIVIPGIAHHVTQRGNRKQQVFFDHQDRTFFLNRLRHYAKMYGMGIASYCLMPNHTHLIVIPETANSIANALKPLHMLYSQYLNNKNNNQGINWQGRYYSAPLDEQHAWHAIRYVNQNPVRAQLTHSMLNYDWSSARALVQKLYDPVLTASNKWIDFAARALENFDLEKTSLGPQTELIRSHTAKNLPIGGNQFIEELEKQYGRPLRPIRLAKEASRMIIR